MVVVRRSDIEKHAVAVAIEYHRPIAGGADHDGTLRGATGRKVVGTVEYRTHARAIALPGVLVESRMNDDDISWLYAREVGIEPVRMRGAEVVSSQQAIEGRLLALALVTGRIDVKCAAICGRPRFGSGSRLQAPLHRALDTVGIGHPQRDLVLCIGLQVEETAGEHRRCDEIEGQVF